MSDDSTGAVLEPESLAPVIRERVILEVGGLDCADCANNLERALNMIPGIAKATVNFATAKATIRLANGEALAEAHRAARDLGFVLVEAGGAVERMSRRTMLTIIAGSLLAVGWAAARFLPDWLAAALVLAAVAVGGFPILRKGIGAVKRRMLTVDVLVSIAVVAAVLSGDALAAGQVVVLMSVGELLEERTVARSRRAVRQLVDLAPKTVTVLRDGREATITRDDVMVGDLVLVRPGGRVPVDGTVVSGRADVSEAPVTGESRLIAKGPGDLLFAGSLAQDGALTLKADHVGPDTTLARIAAMIEDAQSRQAPVARLVDRFAAVFIPISLVAAVLVLVLTREVERSVTILIGACPCALVLSTPVAVYAAIGGASRRGLLVKGGLYLERLGRIDSVAFDKTGTLTSGRLSVSESHVVEGDEASLLTLAAAAETPSEHPVARAIVEAAAGRGLKVDPVDDFRSHPGSGVEAVLQGQRVIAGSPRWLRELGVGIDQATGRAADRFSEQGYTIVGVARDGRLAGLLGLSDTIRPDAPHALARLKAMGVSTWLLSGDSPGAVGRIAAELGVSDYSGGLLPQDKVEAVARIDGLGRGAAMVGDGINDAPALAASSVGIAIGRGGSDLAIETADVVLLSGDLGRVADAIQLGRRTLNNIRFNIALSGVAIVGIFAAAALGYVGPLAGAIVHEGSALLVTLNAMRLIGHPAKEQALAAHDAEQHTHNHAHGADCACGHDHDHSHLHEHAHAHVHTAPVQAPAVQGTSTDQGTSTG